MKVHIYACGLCCMSVCADTDDRVTIEAAANAERPTGIPSPWAISKDPFADGSPNPSPCEQDPTRRHYLLTC